MSKTHLAPLFLVSGLLLAIAGCAHHQGVGDDDMSGASDLGSDGGGAGSGFQVTPDSLQMISVTRGQTTPSVTYMATVDGVATPVAWTVDRGDVGSVPAGPTASATVAPTGTTGGMLTVRARHGSITLSRQIFIQLAGGTQNGADTNNPAEQKQIPTTVLGLGNGGGTGGVGGEGLGGPVGDPALVTALGAPTHDGSAEMLKLAYPYDKTIWPRGMLAPLLMWTWSQGDADAIQIELSTTSGSFSWKGTFAKPAILSQPGTPSGGKFIRHPIPQDIWDIATNTAGGMTPGSGADKLTMKLTVAKGGQAYGPVTQTWVVAPARLTGTVYYNSYGTHLVTNWGGVTDKGGNPIGAAILSVRSGDTDPKLVIGKESPKDGMGIPTDSSGCRVCHIVASRGRYIIAQADDNGNKDSYIYDLNSADPQGTAIKMSTTAATTGTFAWSAMVSDGSYALTNTVSPSSSNPAINKSVSNLWSYGSPAGSNLMSLMINGPPSMVGAGYPSYSPDDTQIAFIDATNNNADVKNERLLSASYDAAMHTFSSVQTLYTPPTDKRVGYPAFLPDNSGVLFEHEVRQGGDSVMVTRNGARSELWWVKPGAMPSAVRLGTLNGKTGATSYLPIAGKNHGIAESGDPQSGADETGFDDTTLSYEPTVLPIVAGGYAWVVFTSRRLYGNQLTQFPWNTWPQKYNTKDLVQANVKKLWVAAIDLNAPAGSDPSHPAFYLPAQEILAGNSRGFWVLDPCKGDGISCQSGDQCCGGYCQPDPANPTSGSLVCTNTSICAGVQEKCTTAADCCDSTNTCVNGFCAEGQIL